MKDARHEEKFLQAIPPKPAANIILEKGVFVTFP